MTIKNLFVQTLKLLHTKLGFFYCSPAPRDDEARAMEAAFIKWVLSSKVQDTDNERYSFNHISQLYIY